MTVGSDFSCRWLAAVACGALLALPLSLTAPRSLAAGETSTPAGADVVAPDDRAQPLAALVRDDVGLYVEVNDLGGLIRNFGNSELFRRLIAFPPLKQWAAEHQARLASLGSEFRNQLGITQDELLGDLFGRRTMLAIWPAATANEPYGPAVLVIEAKDAAFMRRVIARLVVAQRQAHRPIERCRSRHVDVVTYRIQTAKTEPFVYVAGVGRLGVVATNQASVEELIDFVRRSSPAQDGAGRHAAPAALADSPAYASALARLNPDAAVKGFLRPRAWDSLVPKAGAKAAGSQVAQAAAMEFWNAAQYLAVSIDLDEKLTIEAFLNTGSASLDALTEKASAAAGAGEQAKRLPKAALVALAGRVDLLKLLGGMLLDSAAPRRDGSSPPAESSGATVGRQLVAALLSGQGRGASVALVPGQNVVEARRKIGARVSMLDYLAGDLLVGLDSRPVAVGGERSRLNEAMDPLVRTLLSAITYLRQQKDIQVAQVEEDGVSLTTVAGLKQLGVVRTAAIAMQQGYTWVGTSTVPVRTAATLAADDSLARHPQFQDLHNARLATVSHFAYFDMAALRGLVGDALRRASADSSGQAGVPDETSWRNLLDILALADRLLAEASVNASGIDFSLTLAADRAP